MDRSQAVGFSQVPARDHGYGRQISPIAELRAEFLNNIRPGWDPVGRKNQRDLPMDLPMKYRNCMEVFFDLVSFYMDYFGLTSPFQPNAGQTHLQHKAKQKKNAIDLQVLFFCRYETWMDVQEPPSGTDQPTSEAQESSASEEKLSKSNPNKNWN